MDDFSVDNVYTGNLVSDDVYDCGGVSSCENGTQEIENTLKLLTRVDLDLVHSSEKLVNLHVLLMHLLAGETDVQAMALEDNNISETSIEKALIFDLLSGFLDSEVKEVDNFINTLQLEIVDARHKISSCRHLKELFTVLEDKLHDSEESLKQSHEQVLVVKMQSVKLQRTISTFKHEDWKIDEAGSLSENGQTYNINGKSKIWTAKQQRHTLKMLEKSLARELCLEKKLSELKQNEEQLSIKLHHTEQVAFRMEEAAEAVWGRFLEAENAAEVLMGTSKELVGRLQIAQFHLNSSIQGESDSVSKLQDCVEQLKAKDITVNKLEMSNAEHKRKTLELLTLGEKVKLLEEQLKESELRLINANASYEASQEQLCEMENVIESLKESIYETESRTERAEAKVSQLTDSNLELTEEINFLKGHESSNTQKVTLLEKQVRELEIQLQHAKASSEASQEQQNMLYSAIWDMETLIEDLKSKVSKADSKIETVEEQCIILSENNVELTKELSFTRARVDFLETSLDQANDAKVSSAAEINLRSKVIMDMVIQLANERERMQKQLFSLTRENGILAKRLRNTKKDAFATMHNTVDDKEQLFYQYGSSNDTSTKTSEEALRLPKGFQEHDPVCDSKEPSDSQVSGTGEELKLDDDVIPKKAGHFNPTTVFMAIFVALLAGLAMYLLKQENCPL
ncbi:hypothetical protein CFOL_v3_02614 [Cephalotus follicularis]|uniref:WIT1/2 N-terminal helical bundle domain-containing protein n=1 Tax=Cephalotus follicularis TaxID=3775 RepID=A0A1Q3ATM3_CEPFO|nr:hypothetical protein CFOL_v3_02614 [Cephalotus follicularis]